MMEKEAADIAASIQDFIKDEELEEDNKNRLTEAEIREIFIILQRQGESTGEQDLAVAEPRQVNIAQNIDTGSDFLNILWTTAQLVWKFWFSSNHKSSSLCKVSMFRDDFIAENLINVQDDTFQHYSSLKGLVIRKSNNGSNTGLTTLPSSIFCLTCLETLDLNGNMLRNIPSKLWELKCLRTLYLKNCGVEKLSHGLKEMESLRILLLDYNRLRFFEFSELPPNLFRLSLSNNAVKNVSGKLTRKIEFLDISDNFIEDLPNDFFVNATILLACYLGKNKLKSFPPSFLNLESIVRVRAEKNQLTSLPSNFGILETLRHLDISGNKISQLPESIIELRLRNWHCEDNPLQNPPLEVALKELESIKTYFESLKFAHEITRSKRVKIMVLGDKNAGKKLFFIPFVQFLYQGWFIFQVT